MNWPTIIYEGYDEIHTCPVGHVIKYFHMPGQNDKHKAVALYCPVCAKEYQMPSDPRKGEGK